MSQLVVTANVGRDASITASGCDRMVFYNCSAIGHPDLRAPLLYVVFRVCDLYGHPDLRAPYYWRPYQSAVFDTSTGFCS